MISRIIGALFIVLPGIASFALEMPEGKEFTNSAGMKFVRIEAGEFMMGVGETPLPEAVTDKKHLENGDFDERPSHKAVISEPFYMGVYEVTNEQFEQFDAWHRDTRGKLGYSTGDDEAAVFVSWFDAARFCDWLAEREDMPYRLPTEAEWEYACRAGTQTNYHEGPVLETPLYAQRARRSWFPDPARSKDETPQSLKTGQTPANAWGLHDMHGNVEEWCWDWYGPYVEGDATDPVGRSSGLFRVTRGGSHSTELYYLRSANRSGNIPEDKNWLTGFRVAIGGFPDTQPLPPTPPERYQIDVKQENPSDISLDPDPDIPYFKGPRKYVKIPEGANGPMFHRHNHDPALAECPNGDILAIWYSCFEEPGRELAVLASRLRYGCEEWDEASPFWDVPDRNDHAPAMWFDGFRTIYQFCGLSAAATWGNLATVMRTSTDNGATWSKPRLIITEHGIKHMPVESVFRMQDGTIVLPCDAVTGGNGGTVIHTSKDDGNTWNETGGNIAGIHAGVVELSDGRLMALGRGDTIDGRMPMSLSADTGETWSRKASPFPPITSGQRLAFTRLREGPLFLASFANEPVSITDASGKKRDITGLFVALSHDDGETWSIRRPVSDDSRGSKVETIDGKLVTIGVHNGEPKGYLSVCQAPNGVIHLISSRQHYAFNLAWLEATPPMPSKTR